MSDYLRFIIVSISYAKNVQPTNNKSYTVSHDYIGKLQQIWHFP